MKQFAMKYKTYGIILGLLIAVLSVAFFFFRGAAQPSTTTVSLGSSSVDFEDEINYYHTATDGIAVIAAMKERSTQSYSSPEEAWIAVDNTASYNNFTMPEAAKMDDDSIGILTIADIGLSVRVYESADQMEDMDKGVAHFKSTSAWDGTVGLSAHNINLSGSDGYFRNLYQLKSGAELTYETALGLRDYVVVSSKTIPQTDWTELGRTEQNRLVLITCITGQPQNRLCVIAVEKEG